MKVQRTRLKVHVTELESPFTDRTLDFATVPGGKRWKSELARVFEQQCGPFGTWNRIRTVEEKFHEIRRFSRVHKPDDPLAVQRMAWDDYLDGRGPTNAHWVGVTLRSILTHVPDLTPNFRRHMDSHVPPKPRARSGRVSTELSAKEVLQIQRACRRTLKAAQQRIERGRQLLAEFRSSQLDPKTDTYAFAKVLDEIERTGDIANRPPSAPHSRKVGRGVQRELAKLNDGPGVYPLFKLLFPTPVEVAAGLIYCITLTGWNVSVALNIRLSDMRRIDSQVDDDRAVMAIDLNKPRMGSRSAWSEAFNEIGRPDAIETWTENHYDGKIHSIPRVLDLLVDLTSAARDTLAREGDVSDYLFVSLAQGLKLFSDRGGSRSVVAPWVQLTSTMVNRYVVRFEDELEDAEVPTRKDLRQYYVSNVRPSGHSTAVNAEYKLRDPTVRASSKSIIAAGIARALDDGLKAIDFFSQGITEEPPARGDDTPTCRCVDSEHNPLTGAPCRWSFLMCAICPNARTSAKHLPLFIAIYEQLDAERMVLERGRWEQLAPYFDGLKDALEGGTAVPPEVIALARNRITPALRAEALKLLEGEWDVI
jgi:hypothetical protein